MAVMFIDVDKFKTIPVGLNGLILKYDIKWGEMAAGTIMSPGTYHVSICLCPEIYDRRAYGGFG